MIVFNNWHSIQENQLSNDLDVMNVRLKETLLLGVEEQIIRRPKSQSELRTDLRGSFQVVQAVQELNNNNDDTAQSNDVFDDDDDDNDDKQEEEGTVDSEDEQREPEEPDTAESNGEEDEEAVEAVVEEELAAEEEEDVAEAAEEEEDVAEAVEEEEDVAEAAEEAEEEEDVAEEEDEEEDVAEEEEEEEMEETAVSSEDDGDVTCPASPTEEFLKKSKNRKQVERARENLAKLDLNWSKISTAASFRHRS